MTNKNYGAVYVAGVINLLIDLDLLENFIRTGPLGLMGGTRVDLGLRLQGVHSVIKQRKRLR